MKLRISIALFALLLPMICKAGFIVNDDWEKDDCTDKHSYTWCFAKRAALDPNYRFMWPDYELDLKDYKALYSADINDSVSSTQHLASVLGMPVIGAMATGMTPGAISQLMRSSSMVKALTGFNLLDTMHTSLDDKYQVFLVSNNKDQLSKDQVEFYKVWDAYRLKLAGGISYDNDSDNAKTLQKKGMTIIRGGNCEVDLICKVPLSGINIEFSDKLKTGTAEIRKQKVGSWFSGEWYEVLNVLYNAVPFPRIFEAPPECLLVACEPGKAKIVEPTNEQWTELSLQLPASTYIYLPPDRTKGRLYPYILRKGQMMLWVKPKPESEKSAAN